MKKLLIFIFSLSALAGMIFFGKNSVRTESPRKTSRKIVATKPGTTAGIFTKRQRQIMSLLDNNDEVVMKEIERAIPGVNVRTLRRDMDKLQQQGLVRKSGNTKSAIYQKI